MSYSKFSCFKAYDIRGQVPQELNTELSYQIGCAYAKFIQPQKVVVGHDVRLTSESITQALVAGLTSRGVNVTNIGLCGTEEVYFATFYHKFDGGIMVSASHNPIDYNGMKLVRESAKPISVTKGLAAISDLIQSNENYPLVKTGKETYDCNKIPYIKYLVDKIDTQQLKPLKIVVNPGNSSAGIVLDLLEKYLPFELIKICYLPDGNFPNGIPNPLLPENRQITTDAVIEHKADLGIAWDGDFDRCFFFDNDGRYIEGYYIVGLLAQSMLAMHPESAIVYDPRLVWNTIAKVKAAGGKHIISQAGHSFIKETMRDCNAIYGGEMSAHHYFRDFAYCDSGMLPWLYITSLLSSQEKSMAHLVAQAVNDYPCSGEINFTVTDVAQTINKIAVHYAQYDPEINTIDGLSMAFANWRFNIRASNTEPLLRLNIETRSDTKLLEKKVAEITNLITRNKPT